MNKITRNGPGRPRNPESEQAIMDATTDILLERGYRGLTVDRVAARARVSKSTIYRRWPSKERLIVAAFDKLPELAVPDSGDVLEDLVRLLQQFVDFAGTTPLSSILPILVGESMQNPTLRAELVQVVDRRRQPARTILDRAIARGELPVDTPLELATDAVLGPLLLRLLFMPGDTSPRGIRSIVELAIRGIRQGPAHRE